MSRRGDNIHKRKDGRWEGRYKCGINNNGTTAYRSVYGKTYCECKMKLEECKSGQKEIAKCYKKLNFSQVLKLWMNANAIRIKGATKSKYQYMIERHILPELGNQAISTITSQVVNDFINKKSLETSFNGDSVLSRSYVRTIAIIIESALKFAASEELCLPMKTKINKPCPVKRELKIIPSSTQKHMEQILLSEKNRTSLGVLIALHTGMRIGEICALQWDDIDLANRIIFVRHTIARVTTNNETQKTRLILDTPKTPSSYREIPISSVLWSILEDAFAFKHSEFVVSDSDSFISTRTFDYRYRQLFKRNNFEPVNFHTIRHTFATRCIESGMDVKTLSEILGHSSVAITLNTYVHSSMETKRIQIEKLYATA